MAPRLETKTDFDGDVYDAVIVGSGFAGMYMLHKFNGLGLRSVVLEEASDVGGTWYWNRYPGARCDVESMEYSYSFSEELQQEWEWSYRYSTQPEILQYAGHVADRFSLRKHIRFNSRVKSAKYDEVASTWSIRTVDGDIYRGKYCIMATGTLSSVNTPKFEGLSDFQGEWYVTGRWPHEGVDFKNKNVGIIGTGSSAVQSIPVIAEDAASLTVFQRTANYSIPAHNRPLESEEVLKIKQNYSDIRARAKKNRAGIAGMEVGTEKAMDVDEEVRKSEYQRRWENEGTGFTAAYIDIGTDLMANETAASFVKEKIKEVVKDPIKAELLSPTNTIGCKRLCIDTNYFETYNNDHVHIVDVNKTPIKGLTRNGIETTEREYNFDIVVFAIGFDAMTGALLSIDIRGKDDVSLKEKWSEGPRTYLGLASEGFPNMFTITGPGSPSVLSNMMTSIEQHVDWISGFVSHIEDRDKTTVEANKDDEDSWMDHVAEVADGTLRYSCNSWYVGANIPGKKRIFLPYAGGLPQYSDICDKVADEGYSGFTIS
tara:strand:+ start:2641 stop:4266 length:1626 start_codon:yes stop_codon:yes gene_type:complete